MRDMSDAPSSALQLPPAARPAVGIVRALKEAGHVALLCGGCVRDLLLGGEPADFDVATDARPETVVRLFPKTRQVGVQFGVVLVRRRGAWVEVATFRTDAEYLDGRRPSAVTFTDAEHDAQRRDFTVNGMFYDPVAERVIDYVGGRADLAARLIRAIGEPGRRFEEDYLRILRAVRFAARLGFEIEPRTREAMEAHAAKLAQVAPERVRDELARMLAHPRRADAVASLQAHGLLPHLWPGASWEAGQAEAAVERLRALPPGASFTAALAELVADRPVAEVHGLARALTCSNAERETVAWLVAHQGDLVDPATPTLAELKRLMAGPAFEALLVMTATRQRASSDGEERVARLRQRVAGIPPEAVSPAPLVTGEDVAALGVTPGPVYKRLLDEVYTRQLDEQVWTREEALALLRDLAARTP